MVERRTVNADVVGPSPTWGVCRWTFKVKPSEALMCRADARCAQSREQRFICRAVVSSQYIILIKRGYIHMKDIEHKDITSNPLTPMMKHVEPRNMPFRCKVFSKNLT